MSWDHFVFSGFNFWCPVPSLICVEVYVSEKKKRHWGKVQEYLSQRAKKLSWWALLLLFTSGAGGVEVSLLKIFLANLKLIITTE